MFAACCMSASQPRQTACGQCQRYGGARERASRAGHGELNVSMHTEQSSPVHSGSGGAAGTHPRGRPPGRGIEPKAASAVARSPKAWRRCSSNPATHTCSRWARAALSKFRSLERSRLAAAGSHTPATHSEAAGSLRRRSSGAVSPQAARASSPATTPIGPSKDFRKFDPKFAGARSARKFVQNLLDGGKSASKLPV